MEIDMIDDKACELPPECPEDTLELELSFDEATVSQFRKNAGEEVGRDCLAPAFVARTKHMVAFQMLNPERAIGYYQNMIRIWLDGKQRLESEFFYLSEHWYAKDAVECQALQKIRQKEPDEAILRNMAAVFAEGVLPSEVLDRLWPKRKVKRYLLAENDVRKLGSIGTDCLPECRRLEWCRLIPGWRQRLEKAVDQCQVDLFPDGEWIKKVARAANVSEGDLLGRVRGNWRWREYDHRHAVEIFRAIVARILNPSDEWDFDNAIEYCRVVAARIMPWMFNESDDGRRNFCYARVSVSHIAKGLESCPYESVRHPFKAIVLRRYPDADAEAIEQKLKLLYSEYHASLLGLFGSVLSDGSKTVSVKKNTYDGISAAAIAYFMGYKELYFESSTVARVRHYGYSDAWRRAYVHTQFLANRIGDSFQYVVALLVATGAIDKDRVDPCQDWIESFLRTIFNNADA